MLLADQIICFCNLGGCQVLKKPSLGSESKGCGKKCRHSLTLFPQQQHQACLPSICSGRHWLISLKQQKEMSIDALQLEGNGNSPIPMNVIVMTETL